MVAAVFCRKWRIAGWLILALTILIVCTWIWEKCTASLVRGDIYGAWSNPSLLLVYESPRGLFGVGVSIKVYELPPSIRKRFLQADRELLEELPKRGFLRRQSEVAHWRASPLDPALSKELDGLLHQYRDAANFTYFKSQKLMDLKEIESALTHKGAFYAFFRGASSTVLFIVDLEGNRLIEIDHAT